MFKENFMLKVILKVLSVSVVLSSITYANNPWDPRLYAGVSLGGTSLKSQNTFNVQNMGNIQASKKASGNSVHGDLIGGYEISNKIMFAGIEVHAGLSNLATESLLDIAGVQHPFTIESTSGCGVALHVGKFVDQEHRVYLKAGLDVKNFNAHLKGNNRFANHTKSFRNIGFVPGIGVEKKLSDTVIFRTEYKVSLYSSETFSSQHVTHKMKPTTHHLSAGFHFKI
jgi:opacity protein-like surface antigen